MTTLIKGEGLISSDWSDKVWGWFAGAGQIHLRCDHSLIHPPVINLLVTFCLFLSFPSGHFPRSFPTKTPYALLLSFIWITCLAHLNLLDFTALTLHKQHKSLTRRCHQAWVRDSNKNGGNEKYTENREHLPHPFIQWDLVSEIQALKFHGYGTSYFLRQWDAITEGKKLWTDNVEILGSIPYAPSVFCFLFCSRNDWQVRHTSLFNTHLCNITAKWNILIYLKIIYNWY
jgi:hypothetical protein